MFEGFLSGLSPRQIVGTVFLFFSVPIVWELAFVFIRLPKGQRLSFIRQRLRDPFFALYLLVPFSILPAALIWAGLGATPWRGVAMVPVWVGTYLVLAGGYLWRHFRKKRRS